MPLYWLSWRRHWDLRQLGYGRSGFRHLAEKGKSLKESKIVLFSKKKIEIYEMST